MPVEQTAHYRPNPVTDLVLAHVPTYDFLNPPNAADRNARFNAATVAALGNYDLGEQVGDEGTLFTTYELKPKVGVQAAPMAENVVLKVFNAVDSFEPATHFQGSQDDHHSFVESLGVRHVAYTEFATVTESGKSDPMFVAVQERLNGEWLSMVDPQASNRLMSLGDEFTDELRLAGDSFVERAHLMQVEKHIFPEDQIVVDINANGVFAGDTNNPYSLSEVDGNSFLIRHHVDPSTIQHPRDLWNALVGIVPQFAAVADRPWSEIRDDLYAIVRSAKIDMYGGEGYVTGLDDLVELLDYFPPDDSENKVLRHLRELGVASPQREEQVLEHVFDDVPEVVEDVVSEDLFLEERHHDEFPGHQKKIDDIE